MLLVVKPLLTNEIIRCSELVFYSDEERQTLSKHLLLFAGGEFGRMRGYSCVPLGVFSETAACVWQDVAILAYFGIEESFCL